MGIAPVNTGILKGGKHEEGQMAIKVDMGAVKNRDLALDRAAWKSAIHVPE